MKKRKPPRLPSARSRGESPRPQQTYHIEVRPAAAEFISSLTGKNLRLVSGKIDSLANNPAPPNAKRLRGNPDVLRLRAGDYRIIYRVDNERVVVIVVTVGHRKDVYERLPEFLSR